MLADKDAVANVSKAPARVATFHEQLFGWKIDYVPGHRDGLVLSVSIT